MICLLIWQVLKELDTLLMTAQLTKCLSVQRFNITLYSHFDKHHLSVSSLIMASE